MNTLLRLACFRLTSFALGFALLSAAIDAGEPEKGERRFGLNERTEWSKSRIKGSPEPTTPFQSVRVFEKLKFKQRVLITHAPGTDRQRHGPHPQGLVPTTARRNAGLVL